MGLAPFLGFGAFLSFFAVEKHIYLSKVCVSQKVVLHIGRHEATRPFSQYLYDLYTVGKIGTEIQFQKHLH